MALFYVKRDVKDGWEYVSGFDQKKRELLCVDNPFQASMLEEESRAQVLCDVLEEAGEAGFYVSPMVGFGSAEEGDFILGEDGYAPCD